MIDQLIATVAEQLSPADADELIDILDRAGLLPTPADVDRPAITVAPRRPLLVNRFRRPSVRIVH